MTLHAEAGLARQGQHGPVVPQDVAGDGDDSVLSRIREQVVQQRPADTASLPAVGHRHGDIADLACLRVSCVLRHGNDVGAAGRLRHEKTVQRVACSQGIGQHLRQFQYRSEEALCPGGC
jgi:hypothetical protein